ncbi:MAG: DUF362 domain-containing protein [Clostridia bacterium]|nr:DUF362 domain-containing protein [Clostridia bacterium]
MIDCLVSAVKCGSYDADAVRDAMDRLLEPLGGLDFISPGMTVAIKANLVAAMKPERGTTTHPALVKELCRRIVELGATPVVGDSPGGPFTGIYLKGIYSSTGMGAVEEVGGKLNSNFDTCRCEDNPDGAVMKNFTYSAWLRDADVIINFAKLKTHGMMGMSAAVKNLFGAIPGMIKPEYHYRFPNERDFANMLIDIDEFLKPALSIVDGVVGMEGNGPTMGEVKEIGVIAASRSPYALDAYCADVVGLTPDEVPTLRLSIERGLCKEAGEVEVAGDGAGFKVGEFKKIDSTKNIEFFTGLIGFKGEFFNRIAKAALCSKPRLRPSECIGCRKCEGICPAKAITMKKGKPSIDRGKCIRCFCCQEFCPKGALKVHRPLVARILTKSDSSSKKKKNK